MTAPIGIKDILAFEDRTGHPLKLGAPYWSTRTVTLGLQLEEGTALTAERIAEIYQGIPPVKVSCTEGKEFMMVDPANPLLHTDYVRNQLRSQLRHGREVDEVQMPVASLKILDCYISKRMPATLNDLLELAAFCDYVSDDSLSSAINLGIKDCYINESDISLIRDFFNLYEDSSSDLIRSVCRNLIDTLIAKYVGTQVALGKFTIFNEVLASKVDSFLRTFIMRLKPYCFPAEQVFIVLKAHPDADFIGVILDRDVKLIHDLNGLVEEAKRTRSVDEPLVTKLEGILHRARESRG